MIRDPARVASLRQRRTISISITMSSKSNRRCNCIGCSKSVVCGLNGADRCDVCAFNSNYSNQIGKCCMSVCTNMNNEDKMKCISQYEQLLSDHMKISELKEGADVFCSWHVNGVCFVFQYDCVSLSNSMSN
jgi:hypothetical protein